MQAWTEAETSTAVDIAKTEREARRRRQRKPPTGIVRDLEAEIEAFERQMSRWQKFLSKEDSITLLEKIKRIIERGLIDLDSRDAEEVAP
jgi:hypothetical protein